MNKLFSNLFPTHYHTIIYEITQRCNLDCRYCYNVWKNDRPYPKGELKTEDSIKLLNNIISQSRCKSIAITGGEPLLRSDFFEITEYIISRGVDVTLISNGTLLTEENAVKCIDKGITVFEIPLLAANREIHNRLTRGNSFDSSLEAMANIKLAGGDVVAVFVATRENIDQIGEVIELCVGIGVAGIMFNRFNPGGEGGKHREELIPDRTALLNALEIADELSGKYGIPIGSSVPIQPCIIDTSQFKNISFGYCPLGTKSAYFTVDPLGNLRMCNHSPGILGNLLEEDLKTLVNRSKHSELSCALSERCQDCDKVKQCKGGCRAAAESCFGDPSVEDPFLSVNVSEGIK